MFNGKSLYGLATEDIQQINAVLKNYSSIKSAIIYGSRATEIYRNNSDIDLTLVGEGLTIHDLLAIEIELEELMLPYKIDLSIYHKIESEGLRFNIDRDGQVFYSAR